jgi:serine/threonine protein kinase
MANPQKEPAMPIEPNSAKDIFLAAVERANPAERAAFLDEACAGNAELRRRVDALLCAHDEPGNILDRPAPEGGPTAADDAASSDSGAPVAATGSTETVGNRIGPYKLMQRLGEGGMGTVWVAEQQEPVKRRVALKVIKPGLDSAQILRRFEAERQALALMDHVNIAKVLDAGTTDAGRPYFVMELVQGVPITRYCDDLHLPVRERLALFVPVCQAIQHAHQKGIIHRDIKPSNVLVCIKDGKPVPKVIDFGVAKALHQRLTEGTIFTELGAMVGTLEYMSPEQAELSPLGVDTRTDVYALGVLLYELLTGTTPLDRQRLRRAAYGEMVRLIKEEVPSKPSTRLTQSQATLASVAALRQTEPARLKKELRGDLDWIAMRALEKDRTRRYEAASGFARDVERYLHDEPVEACPPSASYRLMKFVRRNKEFVRAVTALFLLLVAGIIGTTWGLVRADRARRDAEQARQDADEAREAEAEQRQLAEADERKAIAAAAAEKKAKETAEAREAETRAVLDFVQNKVFAAARPKGQEGGLGPEVTLRLAIEAALPFVDQSFGNQPLTEARLRMALGTSFYFLGDVKTAAIQWEKARIIYTSQLGTRHPDTLRSMDNVATAYAFLGRNNEALKLREETLALEGATFGPDNPETLATMNNLGASYTALGRNADALRLFEQTLALQKAKLGPDHPETLRTSYNLARVYAALGRRVESVKLHEQTLTLRKAKLGPDHPDTLLSMNNMAGAYGALGRHREALKLREETLALQKAKLPADHPDILASMNNLALTYAALGQNADALKLLEQTLALQKAKLGADHPRTLLGIYNLACIHARMIPESSDRSRQAELAMDWLKKAVAAGYKDVDLMRKDSDLDALRGREDFKNLLAELEGKTDKDGEGKK